MRTSKLLIWWVWITSLGLISIIASGFSTRSNCFLYVIGRWNTGEDGYLLMRRSRYGWWPHFFWSPPPFNTIEEFVPLNDKVIQALPPILFDGKAVSTVAPLLTPIQDLS